MQDGVIKQGEKDLLDFLWKTKLSPITFYENYFHLINIISTAITFARFIIVMVIKLALHFKTKYEKVMAFMV